MDLVSIIVPVYNVEQYLMRCVDSIRRQTYQNLEIILVDDGSPDRCPEMCDEIAAMDPRVKVVHKVNGGLGFARNSGLDVATGEYVTFIDSDDWISEDHIENLYRAAKDTGSDAAIGTHTAVTSAGEVRRRIIQIEPKVYEGAAVRDEIVLPMIGTDPASQKDMVLSASSCMKLYRLDVIEKEKIRFRSEREAVAEDMYFNVDFFCKAKRAVVIDVAGYYYFENLESISRSYNPLRFDRTIRFYEVLKEQAEEYGLDKDVDFRIKRTFLVKIRVLLRLIVTADLSPKAKYQEIRRIIRHKLVRETLDGYPTHTGVPAMRLLTKAMKKGNVMLIYGLVWMREFAENNSILKAALKRIGIKR